MPSNQLVCPHCGHDGTLETSKPPLQSYGFNYLADGVVCREVGGCDESGRLRLTGDFKCEDSQAANARIECRSCWQTFPLPEGVLPVVLAEPPAPASPPPAANQQTKAAAETIATSLVLILRDGLRQMEQSNADEVARVEASLAGVAELAGEVPALRAELAGLRADTAAAEQELRARAEAAETALRAQQEEQPKLWEILENGLRAEMQVLRQRLDAQADVIRALHAVAQEHTSRREELRAAVQRLEEIAGALDQVKPLPKEL